DGTSFDMYRRSAQQVYRRQDARAVKSLPLIPRRGLPKAVSETAEHLLRLEGRRSRHISFEWKQLPANELFRLDRGRHVIYLNIHYRANLLAGKHASRADVPLFKTMLFLLT